MRPTWNKFVHYCSGYYNVLLVLIILLLILKPYKENTVYLASWKILLAGVLLSAIFNCSHPRFIKIITLLLAIPTILLSWIDLLDKSKIIFISNTVLIILFLSICISSILIHSILKTKTAQDALKGVICAYFMVGFLFGYIYYLIDYLIPGSFYFTAAPELSFSYAHYLSEMLYFSFVTLVGIGYGDIFGIKDVAQTASIIEGIIGQFYVAILVSRLVGIYASHSKKKLY